MLDEHEKRRADFVGGSDSAVGVVFADGQTWHLRKPWLTLLPIWGDDPKGDGRIAVGMRRVRVYKEPEINATVELIAGLEHPDEIASGVATLAGLLLRLNYDLVDDELDQLLTFNPDDADSMAWFGAVIETATGLRGRRIVTEAVDV